MAGAVADGSGFLSANRAETRKMHTQKGKGQVAPNQNDKDKVTTT